MTGNDHREINIAVKFNMQYNKNYPERERDMDYLRQRIMTHRSLYTTEINTRVSRYYEAAKTLVDLLDLFMCVKYTMNIKDVAIQIEPDYIAVNGYARLVANFDIINRVSDDDTIGCVRIPITLEICYSNVYDNAIDSSCMGFYHIELYGENDRTYNRVTLGTTYMQDIIDPNSYDRYNNILPYLTIPDDTSSYKPELCYPVDVILKYCSNFSIPSNMIRSYEDGIRYFCTE